MKINIFDNNFTPRSKSSTSGKQPKLFSYVFRENEFSGVTIYTDSFFGKAETTKSDMKIAWQVESPAFSKPPSNPEYFDQIWTYDDELINRNPRLYRRGNFGGTRVKEPQMYPKSRHICIIDSGKRKLPGHRLRGQIAKELDIDVYGRSTKPFGNEADVYKDYRFAVVVENIQHPNYFSEKLTDALACGCIPIYRGSRQNAEALFPGLIHFQTIQELKAILPTLTAEFYKKNKSTEHMEKIAREFNTTEEWLLTENYIRRPLVAMKKKEGRSE